MNLVGNYYKMPEISSLSNLLVKHDEQPELTHYLRLYLLIQTSIITIEENSSGESKVKAGGHGRLLEDPEFIMGITVVQYVLP